MSIKPSSAPLLATIDGLTALERARRNKLMLGLFLPIQNCGWSPSFAPRTTSWDFDYNARLAISADEFGFDLVFGLAIWTGKNGMGGRLKYWETTLDPLMTVAGLAALTHNIMLVSTVHVLYGWHPLHLAKFGATLSHMTNGRWGVNIVTGYASGEFQKFGKAPIEHDLRYVMAAEFTDHMQKLWASGDNVSVTGDYWRMENAFCTPKPTAGRPILVSAASSPAGMEFAAKYCDLIFMTSPVGAEIEAAIAAFPAHTAHVKNIAARHGREFKTIVNPLLICRDTPKEVEEIRRRIVEAVDVEALDGLMTSQRSGDNKSWRGHHRDQRTIGGNIQMFGTPQQVVDWCIRLQKAGVDGIHLSFFDFAPDLEYFGTKVLPLLKEAGLRA